MILFTDFGNIGETIATEECDYSTLVAEESSEDDENETEFEKNENLRLSMKKWAIKHKINHSALKDLMKIVNIRLDKYSNIRALPDDPRTLLKTPLSVSITPMANGEYWHHGIKTCLELLFWDLSESITISFNINIDGLPIFNGSKTDFWPILFNIKEMPHVKPMVIGIFCGAGKCLDVELYLMPFVDEMNDIIANGIYINSHKITAYINCFVCDSPARAFVKSTYSF